MKQLGRIFLLLTALSFFSSLCVFGFNELQEAKSQSTQKHAVLSTSINGRVINESGQPISNVRVLLSGYGAPPVRETVATDDSGKFVFDGLARGIYSVMAQSPGYVSSRDPSDPNQNRPGDSVTLILRKGGVITGTVTGPDGEPVVGVPVAPVPIRDEKGRTVGSSGGGIRYTDDRGVYRIYGLPAGTYLVAAAPKSNIVSSAYGDDATTYYPSSTRDTAVEVPIQLGGEATGIDIRYRGERGRAISGAITDSPAAVAVNAGVFITLSRVSDDGFEGQTYVQERGTDHSFSFYGIGDGDYYLTARRTSGPGSDGGAFKQVPVKVRGQDVTGINIKLIPLGAVTARVIVDSATRNSRCETTQLPSIEESLFTVSNNISKDEDRSLRYASPLVNPNSSGEMTFYGLPSAKYWLDSRRVLDEAWFIREFTAPGPGNTQVDISRNGLPVGQGQRVTGVRLLIAEGAASIRGKVEVKGAASFDDLRVHLVPAEQTAANDTLRYYESALQQDGRFKLVNLAPGRYWLIVKRVSAESMAERLPRPLAWNATTRAALHIEAEASQTTLELKPCQKIIDRVLQYDETKPVPPSKRGSN